MYAWFCHSSPHQGLPLTGADQLTVVPHREPLMIGP
jgi:hypothetical protein